MIKLKHKIPQVDSKLFDYFITNDKIIFDFENVIVDFVVLINKQLLLGKGHYKMTNKSTIVLYAGKLMINNGKIVYIDNDSGHYEPDETDLKSAIRFFNDNQLLSDNFEYKIFKY